MSSFDPDENIRVLDIACDSGRHSVALAIEGADVIEVERTIERVLAYFLVGKLRSCWSLWFATLRYQE